MVFRADGRFLMVRRAQAVLAPGMWTPVTGKCEPGEATAEAAAREVHEEVGLIVTVHREVVFRCPTSNDLYELHWHAAEAVGGVLRLRLREVDACRWVDLDDAAALRPRFPATLEGLRAVVDAHRAG